MTSPTTEVSEVLAFDPMSPHQESIDPVPARNCWKPVVPGSALIWSGGCASMTSSTSWIARTQAALFTRGLMSSALNSHAGSSGCLA